MSDQNNLISPNYRRQAPLPNATAALVLGIISIVGALCYGFVGVVCGIVGLVLANKDRKLYLENPDLYSATSFSTSNSGRICSLIGLILGGIVLLIFIFYLVVFGTFFMEAARHSHSY